MINPYIRFAQHIFYQSERISVNIFDCRIFCITSGCAEIIIENQHFKLSENSLFFCAAGSTYTISSTDGCNILVLNFDLTQERSDKPEPIPPVKLSKSQKPCFNNNFFIEDCDFFNTFFLFNDNMGLSAIIEEIIKEHSEKKIFFMEKCSSVLKNLLIDIYRLSLEQANTSSLAIEKAIRYIKSNYMNKITNKDVSEITCYHEFHTNRLFEKYTGMTIHHYLMETRITEAKKLLLCSDIPIYSIAETIGFNSSSHFITCFKKFVGISPSAYKNHFKNNI